MEIKRKSDNQRNILRIREILNITTWLPFTLPDRLSILDEFIARTAIFMEFVNT